MAADGCVWNEISVFTYSPLLNTRGESVLCLSRTLRHMVRWDRTPSLRLPDEDGRRSVPVPHRSYDEAWPFRAADRHSRTGRRKEHRIPESARRKSFIQMLKIPIFLKESLIPVMLLANADKTLMK